MVGSVNLADEMEVMKPLLNGVVWNLTISHSKNFVHVSDISADLELNFCAYNVLLGKRKRNMQKFHSKKYLAQLLG